MIFLLLLIVLALGLPLIFNLSFLTEGFSLSQSSGAYPNAQTEVLLQDTYPTIGKNQISHDDANDIWQDYPIFQLGSYDQITNNIRYPKNPDVGRCTPASMCGAIYHDKHIGDNYIRPLPPVPVDSGTRVGYFTTDEQLVTSLPYRTDMQNILY